MEIINGQYPPNIDKIKKFLEPPETAIYAFGEKIFNPSKAKLMPDQIIHEEVHKEQQGDDPKGWWDKYLTDKVFRLAVEVEAYAHQYRFLKKALTSKMSKKFLDQFATFLSSQMYGNLLSKSEAETKIRTRAKEINANGATTK